MAHYAAVTEQTIKTKVYTTRPLLINVTLLGPDDTNMSELWPLATDYAL